MNFNDLVQPFLFVFTASIVLYPAFYLTKVIDISYNEKFLFLVIFSFKIYKFDLHQISFPIENKTPSFFDRYNHFSIFNRPSSIFNPILFQIGIEGDFKVLFTPKDRELFYRDIKRLTRENS